LAQLAHRLAVEERRRQRAARASALPAREVVAENDGPAFDRLRQPFVSAGVCLLGEDDVEADDRRASLLDERIDQLRDLRAVPRPAAVLAQAALVDVDDDDALVALGRDA